ncbi:acyltransferase family protein [Thermanaerosceptrum fracticalcis]|uniref:Acyltransferase family protein n=1 Tax=Thermanaerosceptrum fracticalcis TaxID=1712410 RepID=A0A7G6DZR3_THEFR|nr:acyltransferase family protein [Thermanaerosceptrum fracticalcis]
MVVEENMVQRLTEFDRIRGIAILAVITIHVTANATISYSSGSLRFIVYNVINSLAQFAVPLFIFISSIVLSYKFSQERIYLTQFYVKRIKSAIIPYILWSVFYIFYVKMLYGYGDILSWRNWIKWLFYGTSFYHLYFLLIIVQLYLVIPLLYFLFRRISLSVIVVTVIVVQSVFYFINKTFIYQYYPYPACLLGSYISVCFVGTWIGSRYRQVFNLLKSYKKGIYTLSAVSVMVFIFVNITMRMEKPINWIVYYGISQLCSHGFYSYLAHHDKKILLIS